MDERKFNLKITHFKGFFSIILILQIFCFFTPISSAYAISNDILEVTFIDLGTAGDSTLITLPNEKTILIDGGYKKSFSNIKEVFDDNGVSSIDIVIATHDDADHVNGLKQIIEEGIPISEIWVNPLNNTEFPRDDAFPYELKIVSAETISTLDNGIELEILSPPMDLLNSGVDATISNTNSIVSKLTFGNFSFLFGGDATYITEDWILENYSVDEIDVDIMNGFHHGSKYSNTVDFLEKVSPKIVVFSANENNKHGHPSEEAIENYETVGASTYQTGIDGNIIIKTNGSECSIIVDEDVNPCFEGVNEVLGEPSPNNPNPPSEDDTVETIRSSLETINSAIDTAENAIDLTKSAMSLGEPVSESAISSLESVSSALDIAKNAVTETSPAIETVSYQLENENPGTTNFEVNIGNQEGNADVKKDALDMIVEEGIAQVAAILSLGVGALVTWARGRGIPITQEQEKAFKEMVTTRFKKLARETWTSFRSEDDAFLKWKTDLDQGRIPEKLAKKLREEGKSFAVELLKNREFQGFAKTLTKQGKDALDDYLKDIRNNLKGEYKKNMVDVIPKLVSIAVDSTFETFEKGKNYDELLNVFLTKTQDKFVEEMGDYIKQRKSFLEESTKKTEFNYKCYLELVSLQTLENLKPILLSTEALDSKENLKLLINSEINKKAAAVK